MGSGTVIAKNDDSYYVLTNKHVVSAMDKRVYVLYKGKRYNAQFVKSHTDVDLTLVLVKFDVDAPVVILAESEPKEGDYVKHYGKATGFQEGKMIGWTNFATSDGMSMNSKIFSVPGDSGSGMFNKDGQLVAVHYARKGPVDDPDADDNCAIAVRLSKVKELVKEFVK